MLDTPSSILHIRALGAAAEVLALRGDLDGAVQVMDRALRTADAVADPRERIRAMLDAAAGAAVICPVEQALRAANAIERLEDRLGALGVVAGALARAGRPSRAVEALAPVADGNLTPWGLRALAAALVMAGEVDRAVAVAGRDPDPSWGWDAFVRALVQAGRLDHAYATARFLVTEPSRRDVALLIVAEALAESRNGDRAQEVAEHITDPSYRGQAMQAAALAIDNPHRTAELLERAAAVARAITHPGGHQTRLQDLAVIWAERGELDRARAAVDSIEFPGRRAASHVALALVLVQQDRTDQAAAVLDDASALVNSDDPDSDLLADVAAAMARAGGLDRAAALARTSTDFFRRMQALARVARAMSEGGHAERAGELLNEVATTAVAAHGADDIRHIYGLTELAGGLVHAGRREQAGELLHRAERLVHTLYDHEERLEAWRLLANALGRAGLLDRADPIAHQHGAWVQLVRALCDAGAFDQAEERAPSIPDPSRRSWALQRVAAGHAADGRLDRAESVAYSIEEAAPRSKALLAAAAARAQTGRLNRAVELLHEAETAARSIPDRRDRDQRLRELVEALLTIGRLDRAAELLDHAVELLDRAEAAGSAAPKSPAEVMIASGRLDRALQVALDLPDLLAQCRAVASVGEAYAAAAARPERVSQVLRYAEAISTSTTDSGLRIRLQARLARAWAVTGDVGQANRTIEQLLARDAPMPGQATVDLAEALSVLGRHDRALALTANHADPRVAAAVTAVVAISTARSGDPTRAIDLVRSLPDAEPREWVLAEVARAVARSGDLDHALHLIHPGHATDGNR